MRRLLTLIAVLVLTLAIVAPVSAVRQEVGGGTNFVAILTGANEVTREGVRNQGDPDGFGLAIVNVNPELERVCWIISVRNIEPATLAHIHRGPATTTGGVVVDLMPPLPNPTSFGCNDGEQVTSELANEIISNPAGFYVNVHNGTYPSGAVRGQLRSLPMVGMPGMPTLTGLFR